MRFVVVSVVPRRHRRSHTLVSPLAVSLLLALPAAFSWCFSAGTPFQRRHLHNTIVRQAESNPTIDGQAASDRGATELMLAAHRNDAAGVRQNVADGAEINARDTEGWTALKYAIDAHQLKTASALIELGADINLASSSGRTPLMSAAAKSLPDAVHLLLDAGANPSLKNEMGESAADLAGRNLGALAIRDMLSKAEAETA